MASSLMMNIIARLSSVGTNTLWQVDFMSKLNRDIITRLVTAGGISDIISTTLFTIPEALKIAITISARMGDISSRFKVMRPAMRLRYKKRDSFDNGIASPTKIKLR